MFFKTFRVKNVLAPEKRELLLSILCWVMFEAGFALLLMPFFDLEDASEGYWFQIANFCASFILTVLCFMPFLKKSIENTKRKGFEGSLFVGYGIEMALTFVVAVIIFVLDIVFRETNVNVNQQIVTQMLHQKSVPMILCTVVLAPITEECLVRGVLFAPLCRYKPWLAYAVSAVVFSMLHVLVSVGSASAVSLVEDFLSYLPSGIALGWIYQRTGTIIGPIALHSLSNLFSVITILWAF